MPEQPQEPTTPEPTATETPTETASEAPEKDWAAEAEKWKTLARKHETQAKANADKAKRFDEVEEASKSELQKAQERAEAAERALKVREAESLRASIALEKGLTASQAKRLVGTTREELEADATELLADLKAAVPPAPPATGQGSTGAPIQGHSDPIKELDERIAAADKARNFTLAIQLKRERAALAAAAPTT